jgi:peptidoglycan hydrolase CwlO-like protein
MCIKILMLLCLSFFLNTSLYSDDKKPKAQPSQSGSAEYDKEEKKPVKKKPVKKKHDITDTQKKLKIRKGDITDIKKGLGLRTGDLIDTKKMLRRTDYPNQDQLAIMRWQLIVKLQGPSNYKAANGKSPKLVSTRLRYTWNILQEDSDLHRRKQSLKVKDLSDKRKKFLNDKIKEIEQAKKSLAKKIEVIDGQLMKLAKNQKIVGTGDYFNNKVTADFVDLVDKVGSPKHRIKKGAKIQTKVSKLDPNNFYEVKYKGEFLYVMRKNFAVK